MTETTSERDYLPGMGKHFLLPLYDVVHRLFRVGRVHEEMIERAGLTAGQRVLDIGCGTGNLLRATATRRPDVELSGLDPDPKALARARRKVKKARLERGFAQELPYPDDSFDRVFSSLMLHHLDTKSKDEMLAEVRRVLRPGGVFVLADIKVDQHSHGHGSRPMSEHLHDNVGDAIAQRLEAAGFTTEPTHTMILRKNWQVGIEVAR
ncbi:methyltransferase family protein [Labedaea rhizosphaerae]|uniref:Methyltransferase family protein n=2 Tax=Labedaea rhizosphaerae TaxID=598644 RepID=A0A4R6S650_LABRH|nr:methyltransferase family protein [Labedaea rhizosphaerae]